MRPAVHSVTQLPPFGRDLSTPDGKSWLYRIEAGRCVSAANTLADHHPYRNETPHYIILFHAIELALKAFLINTGIDEGKLGKSPYRHDLCALYREAVGRGMNLASPDAEGLIRWINEWHCVGVKIRYEFATDRDLPACGVLSPLAQEIIEASE
jgi:hypothetical protein